MFMPRYNSFTTLVDNYPHNDGIDMDATDITGLSVSIEHLDEFTTDVFQDELAYTSIAILGTLDDCTSRWL